MCAPKPARVDSSRGEGPYQCWFAVGYGMSGSRPFRTGIVFWAGVEGQASLEFKGLNGPAIFVWKSGICREGLAAVSFVATRCPRVPVSKRSCERGLLWLRHWLAPV